MLQLRHLILLISSKILDVSTTYYGVINGIAYEVNPLWNVVNKNPELTIIGLIVVTFVGISAFILQPILAAKSKSVREKEFCLKAIDLSFYISIATNIVVGVNNILQLIL